MSTNDRNLAAGRYVQDAPQRWGVISVNSMENVVRKRDSSVGSPEFPEG